MSRGLGRVERNLLETLTRMTAANKEAFDAVDEADFWGYKLDTLFVWYGVEAKRRTPYVGDYFAYFDPPGRGNFDSWRRAARSLARKGLIEREWDLDWAPYGYEQRPPARTCIIRLANQASRKQQR